jgi:hypothetical protein
MQPLVTRGLVALTLVALAAGLVSCGDDDGASPTVSLTSSPAAAPTDTGAATVTEEPTASPLSAQSPEVQQTLALPGFAEFAREFQAAVDANNVQFFIDRAYFQVPDCPSPGATPSASPRFCMGMGAPPTGPAILVGAWNSEGDSIPADYYSEHIAAGLSADEAPDAYVYAVGGEKHPLGFGDSEVGIIVAFPGRLSPAPTTPDQSIYAFRVDRIGGEWRIVSVDGGLESLVPYFFDWYAPWAVMTARYTNDTFRVEFDFPANWTRDPNYSDDTSYRDPAGRESGYFVVDACCQGMASIDDVAQLHAAHHLKPYGDNPTIVPLTVSGRDARLILPDGNASQISDAELIVPYASSLTTSYDFFVLHAHKDFIRSIGQTLRLTD